MAKKSLKINQFHGGLNNYRDRRDTPEDALVNASNIMVDVPGKIRIMGRDVSSNINSAQHDGGIKGMTTPGYGLFAFKSDHDISGANTQDAEFIVYQAQNNFHVAQGGTIYMPSGSGDYGSGGIATNWTGTSKPNFLYSNERLFISDGEYSNIGNAPHVFEYLSNTLFTSSNSIVTAASGWHTNLASYPAPLDGNLSIDANAAVQPAALTDQYIKVSVENDNDGIGQWENQNIWLGVSAVYGDEESRINTSEAYTALSSTKGSLQLGFSMSLETGTVAIDDRITSFKVYLLALNTGTSPEYYKDPYLLATADMVDETFISNEGISVGFTYDAGDPIKRYESASMLGISSLPTTTFEMENLYAHDADTIRAKWKTSTKVGNAIYVGNIRTLNDSGVEIDVNPDKILRSIAPPGSKRMGIFPSTDFLDVTVGDGDEIVALESFADKLLVFKRDTVFIINVAGDIEYIELERKFIGISNPYNVTKTELGIAWATPQGAFIYDGEKITNLIDGKLDPSVEFVSDALSMPGWADFIGTTDGGQVAYIPALKQLVVLDSPVTPGENNQGNMFIYDFRTKSWTYGTDRITSQPRSSVLTGHNKSFLWLGSLSSPGNVVNTNVLIEGTPAVDYRALILNLNDEMVTLGEDTYQIKLDDDTALTAAFTYNSSDGASFADKIVAEISTYNDLASNDNITVNTLRISSSIENSPDAVEIVFKSITSDDTIPTIYDQSMDWDVSDTNVIPATTLAAFLQAGTGHAVAPVRAWYQGDCMDNMTNHGWGEDHEFTGIGATWGGNPTTATMPWTGYSDNYPLPDVSLSTGVGGTLIAGFNNTWYHIFFPGQNLIYAWILNHMRLVLGLTPTPGVVNQHELHASYGNLTPFNEQEWLRNQLHLPENSYTDLVNGIEIGHPWGYRGLHPAIFELMDRDTLGFDDEASQFRPIIEYKKRNNITSPLFSYTGFVIRASGWREKHLSHEVNSTLPGIRSNPRLIKYMCDFPENTDLGDEFILPNDDNSGNYVSPGLLFTQAWTEGEDDSYTPTLKERSPNGNGWYKDDKKSQTDSIYPNGYFFLGFGHDAGELIEGNGVFDSRLTCRSTENQPVINAPMNTGSYLFQDLYFLSRKIDWDPNGVDLDPLSISGRAHKSIAQDVFEPEKHRIFKNFGDMGSAGPVTLGIDDIEDGVDTSVNSPSILLRDGIPFNQQSLIEDGDARQNPITRDEAFIKEVDGIYTIGSLKVSEGNWGSRNAFYARPGQFNNSGDGTAGYSQSGASWGSDQYASYTSNQPICYTSMPYLVVDVKKDAGVVSMVSLHMICDISTNLSHATNDIYSYEIKGGDDRNYSLTDAKLTSAYLVNVETKDTYTSNTNGMVNTGSNNQPDIPSIDNKAWGLNGYLRLDFSYSDQDSSVKDQINSSGMHTTGTVAFWSNPLKVEAASGDGASMTGSKDPIALDSGNNEISDVPNSLTTFTGSSSPFFNIISKGSKGTRREVILHSKKGYTTESSDSTSLAVTVSRGPYRTSVVNNNIEWDTNYDSIYNITTLDPSGNGNSILEKFNQANTDDLYNTVANVQRTLDLSVTIADPGVLTITGADETKYFKVGDAIWFETNPPVHADDKYLITDIDYNITSDLNTVITLEGNTPPTHATTVSGSSVYLSKFSAADIIYADGPGKIVYGSALHFKGALLPAQDDLIASGSFSGSLQVMTFENGTQWVEDNNSTGAIYIETKDFDFGNPSSLKNINYIDISMKAKSGNLRVEYAINNKTVPGVWIPFPDEYSLSNSFETYRYKLAKGSITNINSIRLRISTASQIVTDDTSNNAFASFELNDITIVYREKALGNKSSPH